MRIIAFLLICAAVALSYGGPRVGEVYTIRKGVWKCGPPVTYRRTFSLSRGLWVRILSAESDGNYNVRVLGMYMEDDKNGNKMRLFKGDPRTGKDCLVTGSALDSPAHAQ
jgi:hypothetical protein